MKPEKGAIGIRLLIVVFFSTLQSVVVEIVAGLKRASKGKTTR